MQERAHNSFYFAATCGSRWTIEMSSLIKGDDAIGYTIAALYLFHRDDHEVIPSFLASINRRLPLYRICSFPVAPVRGMETILNAPIRCPFPSTFISKLFLNTRNFNLNHNLIVVDIFCYVLQRRRRATTEHSDE
jgi:hypothetical protein